MNLQHGMSRTTTYYVWNNMRSRCRDPNCENYTNYGGRGIKVCERWESFANFVWDMGVQPAGLTLDRIDTNGDYTPDNCRWVTQLDQQRNRRTNVLLSHNGTTQCHSAWAEQAGISTQLFHYRLKQGWPIERALTPPTTKESHG